MDSRLLDELGIELVDKESMPIGFKQLTIPIDIEKEEHLVRSIWSILKGKGGVARKTEFEGMVEFWCRIINPQYVRVRKRPERCKRAADTRCLR